VYLGASFRFFNKIHLRLSKVIWSSPTEACRSRSAWPWAFSEAWVLDLRSLGLLHRARTPPASSPALSATSVGFPAVSLRRRRAWVHAPLCLRGFFFFSSSLFLWVGCFLGAFSVVGFWVSLGFCCYLGV
jgi:hypothetical protein